MSDAALPSPAALTAATRDLTRALDDFANALAGAIEAAPSEADADSLCEIASAVLRLCMALSPLREARA